MAQSPTSEPVNYADAIRFTQQHPEYAKDFTFSEGKAVCINADALAAFKGTSTDAVKVASQTTTVITGKGGATKGQQVEATVAADGAESPLAIVDREIAALEVQVKALPVNADSPMRDQLELLKNERTRLQTTK
jgi:shikimate 5-dehydrogenase